MTDATIDLDGMDFGAMAGAIEAANKPPLEPGRYLAVVNKVTTKENEDTGSFGFVFDLRINSSEDVTRWDPEAKTFKHSQYAWYGYRQDGGGWKFDKNGNPGFLPPQFFNALDVTDFKHIDLNAMVGKVIQVAVIHEKDRNDDEVLRLAVQRVRSFYLDGVKAPRLDGYEVQETVTAEASDDAF